MRRTIADLWIVKGLSTCNFSNVRSTLQGSYGSLRSKLGRWIVAIRIGEVAAIQVDWVDRCDPCWRGGSLRSKLTRWIVAIQVDEVDRCDPS
jgi:hypothetical protein